jgi:hypothetical protein
LKCPKIQNVSEDLILQVQKANPQKSRKLEDFTFTQPIQEQLAIKDQLIGLAHQIQHHRKMGVFLPL